MLLGIKREPIRNTQAVGGQQQSEDKAVFRAAVELLLVAIGLAGAFLGIAARVGVLRVLALLTMHGGVDGENVQAVGAVAGSMQELGSEQQREEQPVPSSRRASGAASQHRGYRGGWSRAAAATERRHVGRRKEVINSSEQAQSELLPEKSARKALKRGREVEKIIPTSGCRVLAAAVQRSGRDHFTQRIFVHLSPYFPPSIARSLKTRKRGKPSPFPILHLSRCKEQEKARPLRAHFLSGRNLFRCSGGARLNT